MTRCRSKGSRSESPPRRGGGTRETGGLCAQRLANWHERVAFSGLALDHRADRRLTEDASHLEQADRVRDRVQESATGVSDLVDDAVDLVSLTNHDTVVLALVDIEAASCVGPNDLGRCYGGLNGRERVGLVGDLLDHVLNCRTQRLLGEDACGADCAPANRTLLFDLNPVPLGNDDATHAGEGANLYDPAGALGGQKNLLNITENVLASVSTDRWRAEFVQFGCGPTAESGPRIIELDGFAEPDVPAVFVLLDAEAIDTDTPAIEALAVVLGVTPASLVNDAIADVGERTPLPILAGTVLTLPMGPSLPTGQVGDEGWYVLNGTESDR